MKRIIILVAFISIFTGAYATEISSKPRVDGYVARSGLNINQFCVEKFNNDSDSRLKCLEKALAPGFYHASTLNFCGVFLDYAERLDCLDRIKNRTYDYDQLQICRSLKSSAKRFFCLAKLDSKVKIPLQTEDFVVQSRQIKKYDAVQQIKNQALMTCIRYDWYVLESFDWENELCKEDLNSKLESYFECSVRGFCLNSEASR